MQDTSLKLCGGLVHIVVRWQVRAISFAVNEEWQQRKLPLHAQV
jgi:hypothetical protein